MEYKEISLLKQSDRGTIHLVQDKSGKERFVRKVLKGQYPIYTQLQSISHPNLPKVYEAVLDGESTTVIEEYIAGKALGSTALSEKQFLGVVRELCDVLEYLHGEGIIHRDIKPSNLIMADDGHVRLIDFDAARIPKTEQEQDTHLLGTRGYAAPEQYGFAQTDERTDVYSLGITLERILGDDYKRPRYKKILHKCSDLDPNKRYQTVREVRDAFLRKRQKRIYCWAAVCAVLVLMSGMAFYKAGVFGGGNDESTKLTVLPTPKDPHWDGDTGTMLWGNVPESGHGDGVSERTYWATWGNLDEYEDKDHFDVWVYDQDGNYVMNNIWTKEWIEERGNGGIRIRKEFLSDREGSYRFTVRVLTSRPNEFQCSPMPDPVPEEYYSPWYSN